MKVYKFLADVNVEKLIVDNLRHKGYDTKWVLEENRYLADKDVLELASFEKRILITNDKDFGEIVFRQKLISNGIILFRIKEQDEILKSNLLNNLLDSENLDMENYFIIISKDKIRRILI